jgi:hypothetical protein
VSRQRQSIVVWWMEDDGVRHEQRLTFRDEEEPLSRVAPPRAAWLVEVFDPVRHRVAVLAANAGHPPLLYAPRSGSPAWMLLADGLVSAFINRDEQGRPVVAPFGTPAAQVPAWCPVCRQEWPVQAERLRDKSGPKPGKPGRFTIGVAHSA